MELPLVIQETLVRVKATLATTWSIQVLKGKIHLTVDFDREAEPTSLERCSTFREGISPPRTGHPPSDSDLQKDDDKRRTQTKDSQKKKRKRKKGPSARRRDARRLKVFMEKKRTEKEEREANHGIERSMPATPVRSTSSSVPSTPVEGPEDAGSPGNSPTSSPSHSSPEEEMEEDSLFVEQEVEADIAHVAKPTLALPAFSDRDTIQEANTAESVESILGEKDRDDDPLIFLQAHIKALRDRGCKGNMLRIGLESLSNHYLRTTPTSSSPPAAARARPYQPSQPSTTPSTPPKGVSPTQPPPPKKSRQNHRRR